MWYCSLKSHLGFFFVTVRCPISRLLRLPALGAPPPPPPHTALPPRSLCCTRCSRRVHVHRMTSLWLQLRPTPPTVFFFNFSFYLFIFFQLYFILKRTDPDSLICKMTGIIMWDEVPRSPDPPLPFVLSGAAARCGGLLALIRSGLLHWIAVKLKSICWKQQAEHVCWCTLTLLRVFFLFPPSSSGLSLPSNTATWQL